MPCTSVCDSESLNRVSVEREQDQTDFWLAMTAFGYALDDPDAALRAFRRRFRAMEGSDAPRDAEDARILHSLVEPLRSPRAASPAD